MRRLNALTLATLAIVLSCGEFDMGAEPRADLVPLDLAHALTHGPRPDFYFLPAIAEQPDLTGVRLDTTVDPTVRVCEWRQNACTGPVWTYGRAEGPGAQAAGVQAQGGGHFMLQWQPPSRGSDVVYRISVQVGAAVLGWADVQIGRGGRTARVPQQAVDRVVLAQGRFPIRFAVGVPGGPLNTPPVLSIAAPADGGVHGLGEPVALSGSASDAEDGDLSASIEWSSDLDGALGTGASLEATLLRGPHHITATVSDAAGASASASIGLEVLPRIAVGAGTAGELVGAGLVDARPCALPSGDHGGVRVTIESGDPDRLLVSAAADEAGAAAIGLDVPAGSSDCGFHVHGVEGAGGGVDVVVAASGFAPAAAPVTVAQPGLLLTGLATSTTSLSADDPFAVRVGVPVSGGFVAQPVRPGAAPLQVTVTTSDTAVARVVDGSGAGETATTLIQPGASVSPSTVAAGGVALDPGGYGTVTVAASAPGSAANGGSSLDVAVDAPRILIGNGSAGNLLGAGLQERRTCNLETGAHGGVVVRIESSDPSLALVSTGASAAGQPAIEFNLADGLRGCTFYIQALEGVTGTATVTASARAFRDSTTPSQVVQPAYQIDGLNTSHSAGGLVDHFYVRVGVPANNGSAVMVQQLRAGATPLDVVVRSSNGLVGTLVTNWDEGPTVTVHVQPGQVGTPTVVGGGGVGFRPLTGGTTTLDAAIAGFLPTTASSITVTVNEP